jgi:hypothetical protein
VFLGHKPPMVVERWALNEHLIHLCFHRDVFFLPGAVIADGNASSAETKFFVSRELDDLKHLNVHAINSPKYRDDPVAKRQKQAELMIPDRLSLQMLTMIICSSSTTEKSVLAILNDRGTKVETEVNPGWYYLGPEASE